MRLNKQKIWPVAAGKVAVLSLRPQLRQWLRQAPGQSLVFFEDIGSLAGEMARQAPAYLLVDPDYCDNQGRDGLELALYFQDLFPKVPVGVIRTKT